LSWINIGGPQILPDSRNIEAMDDNILFAISIKGEIWFTRNAGAHYFQKNIRDTLREFSSARIINDSFNVAIHLPIYFQPNGTFGSADMIMHYPTTSLKLLDTKLYNGKSFVVAGQSWNGRTALHFDQTDLRGEADSLLGYIDFLWTPRESDCATIDFDSVMTDGCFENPIGNFHGIIGSNPFCASLEVSSQIVNTAELPFTFSPNPAGEYGSITSKYYSGEIIISIYDNLGRLLHICDGEISPGQVFKFLFAGIPSGTYALRIHSRIGEDELKIVVSK
jgi:hypothetical protein